MVGEYVCQSGEKLRFVQQLVGQQLTGQQLTEQKLTGLLALRLHACGMLQSCERLASLLQACELLQSS